jgi:hypothetical protein
MTDLIYKYPPLLPGILIKRYNILLIAEIVLILLRGIVPIAFTENCSDRQLVQV